MTPHHMASRRLSQTSYSPLPSVCERSASAPSSAPTGVSPPDQSPWTPLPPFQCLQALGANASRGDILSQFGDCSDTLGLFSAEEDIQNNKRLSTGPDSLSKRVLFYFIILLY